MEELSNIKRRVDDDNLEEMPNRFILELLSVGHEVNYDYDDVTGTALLHENQPSFFFFF